MPRATNKKCPYRRLANGEWIQESLGFAPISLDFILRESRAKPDLWLGEGRYLHTLRRLSYEGDMQSVRVLSQLQGCDKSKNAELQDLLKSGNASRLEEAIDYCDKYQ